MSTVAEQNGQASVTEKPSRPSVENYVAPVVNIYETPEGYVLEADLPGVGKDGIDISAEADHLTIVGHRETVQPVGEELYRESQVAGYRRQFELDPAIDSTRISAKLHQGVLVVSLPKSERAKPRKINVGE